MAGIILQLENPLQRFEEREDFLTAEISNIENISKTLNNYITELDCANKTLSASSGVSACSIAAVIGMPVAIATDCISLVILTSNYIAKVFLKIIGRKTQTQNDCFRG